MFAGRRRVRRLGWLLLMLAAAGPAWTAPIQPLSPVAERIREQVDQWRAARVAAGDLAGTAAVAFYEQDGFAPAWGRAGNVEQLLAALRGMAADGLDPSDYDLVELEHRHAVLDGAQGTPLQRAQFDVLATDACLTALLHLYRGKVDPATLDPQWNVDPRTLDATRGPQALREALAQGRIDALFDHARPQHPLYGQLREGLARLRQVAAQGGWPPILPGRTLKPGMTDPRVPALRRRLVLGGYLSAAPSSGPAYDAPLQAALMAFQQAQQLTADGELGEATRAALNVPVQARIAQLRVNLERARWLLHQLQGDFVVVDIAGYSVALYRGGRPVWRSRVQVGKPYRRTPVFKSRITYITLNPTWTVPPTILRNDIAPKVRRNPGYLSANRIRVLDAQGNRLDPAAVDWSHPRGVVLRQDAGPGNSLGRLAIRFPNPYAVYMHDTPHTELFARAQRANSSGCIRVERPRELAERLLDDPAWNRAALDRAIDTGVTQTVLLRRPVPLLLGYWTVRPGEGGRIEFRPDIYHRDAAVLSALNRHRPAPLLLGADTP